MVPNSRRFNKGEAFVVKGKTYITIEDQGHKVTATDEDTWSSLMIQKAGTGGEPVPARKYTHYPKTDIDECSEEYEVFDLEKAEEYLRSLDEPTPRPDSVDALIDDNEIVEDD